MGTLLTQAVGLGWARSPLWGSTGIVVSRAEGAGEVAGRWAGVELQQFCFGKGDGSGVPIPIDDARLPLGYRA
jgi:hypothetical protein